MTVETAPSIRDLRELARQALPSVMFDYLEGAAEDEVTARRNERSFDQWRFRPRVLRDVTSIDLSTSVLGADLALPVFTAPTGLTRMFHHDGERAAAAASHAAGTGYCLSTVGTTSIEEVRAAHPGPLFFQIYAWHDRRMVDDFIERCRAQSYHGILLAVDLAALGKRDRDLHNGHGRPRALRVNTAKAALRRPTWLYHYLTKPAWRMANMVDHLPHGANALKVVDEVNAQFDASVDWGRARAMRDAWDGPFVLKGVQHVDDAVLAAEMGCDAIVLSNHGGRQLDGAPTALDLLPAVRSAVGSGMEIWVDGGIRRGSDIIKALCLGADCCLIGRAMLYGLAAGGQAGVERAYAILRDEMERTMRLVGCERVSALGMEYVERVERG